MRHASITTTMNIYGKAMTETKRQANGKVVQMILKTEQSDQDQTDSPMAIGS
jgi:integrase